MAHIKAFFTALGGKWLLLPGVLSGVIGVLGIFRDDLGVSLIPEISWPLIALLAATPIVAWSIAGLTHANVKMARQLEELQCAWDRSGRNLIPIRDAMDIIIKNLSDQWQDDIDEEKNTI